MARKKLPITATPKLEQELTKWSCSLFGNKSEIDVFVESTGQWETAAEIYGAGKFDAEEVAAFIMDAIAASEKMKKMQC